jgi:spore maturation protein CgeB
MRIVLFYHSFLSDWNHGNAHFLRGVVSELVARGHAVQVYEPEDGWSVRNLVADAGEAPLQEIARQYPDVQITRYGAELLDDARLLDRALEGAELAIVHEWNPPGLVARIGARRPRSGGPALLFHDTHHRSVSAPEEMAAYDLRHYDGVLAFGRVIRDLYVARGWSRRAWVWHEAADTRVFRPLALDKTEDLVWIGNWGDGERTDELESFLFAPLRALRLRATVHGVRYPDEARRAHAEAGARYGGWVPNRAVARAYAQARVTVHVPRRHYATALPGIPTIRVFEALACGIPLVSAPWQDSERLFTPGRDFLVARSTEEMTAHLRALVADPALASAVGEQGLATVRARHTCAHRVDELLAIAAELGVAGAQPTTLPLPIAEAR